MQDRVEVRLRLRQLDAAAGELDRRLHQHPPRQPAERAVRHLQPDDHSGNGAGGGTDPEELRSRVREIDDHLVHRGPGRVVEADSGRGDEEIEDPRAPVAGGMDEHEPTAAGSRERALGDPGGERRSHARVDRVAALRERPRPRFGRQPVPGRDGSSHLRLMRRA